MKSLIPALITFLALNLCAQVHGQTLTVDAPWSDDAFVQRGKPFILSGQAAAQANVTVKFQDAEKNAAADSSGHWQVSMPAVTKAGGPFPLDVTSQKEAVDFKNVLVGDIWICSGQSNMEFPVHAAANGVQAVQAATCPTLRLLHVTRRSSATPHDDLQDRWQACSPTTVPDFTAVGYFFGLELAQKAGVPIGLIEASWGGKLGQVFMRREAVENNPVLAPIAKNWDDYMRLYPGLVAAFQQKNPGAATELPEDTTPFMSSTVNLQEIAKRRALPRPPEGANSTLAPGNLWNGMIRPLTKIPITGAIWYQGESNAAFGDQYRTLLSTLITDWRAQWGQGDFPFYIVQLPNFQVKGALPGFSTWAELREAQSAAGQLPNSGIAVTIDLGAPTKLHPPNKEPVGMRLALLALHQVYGQSVADEGPTYDRMEIKDNTVTVHFQHADGLHSTGPDVESFSVAGADKVFHPATATIAGETVTVSCADVPAPVAVRYAWEDSPATDLYNAAQLPAAPFRTDTWPVFSTGKSWHIRLPKTVISQPTSDVPSPAPGG